MRTRLFFLLCPVFFLIACSENKLDIDVSSVKVDKISIDRMEQDLFNYKSQDVRDLQRQLKKKYGSFYDNLQSVINTVGKRDSGDLFNLRMYIHDPEMIQTYKDCQQSYPDLNWLEKDITEVYKYFHFYFPSRLLPKVITDMSAFYFFVLRVDSTIGIDIEMYLGSENSMYQMIQFPKYKTQCMRKEYMVPDFVKGWMMTEFQKDEEKKDLLSEMIYQGKLLYLSDALLPLAEDTVKIGYTGKQLKWCKDNEYNMWAYFVQKKLLYVSDPSEIVKYTGEGPFTAAFNKESPSRVGIWIGWQIVRSYMNHHKGITLEQLMKEKDAQIILSQSKYKPAK